MKRSFTNTQSHVVYIDGKSVAPGETREIAASAHPDYVRPAPKLPEPEDFLKTLSTKPVKTIIAELEGLRDQELAQLDQLERAKPAAEQRKTLSEAIGRVQLERAQAASELDQFAKGLHLKPLDELGELAELHADDAQLSALIIAEIEQRPRVK